MKWYEEIKQEMEDAIKYAVDHNAPSPFLQK